MLDDVNPAVGCKRSCQLQALGWRKRTLPDLAGDDEAACEKSVARLGTRPENKVDCRLGPSREGRPRTESWPGFGKRQPIAVLLAAPSTRGGKKKGFGVAGRRIGFHLGQRTGYSERGHGCGYGLGAFSDSDRGCDSGRAGAVEVLLKTHACRLADDRTPRRLIG